MREPHVTYDGTMDAFWQKSVLFPCNSCAVGFACALSHTTDPVTQLVVVREEQVLIHI